MQSGETYKKYRFSIRPQCVVCNRDKSSGHYATLIGRATKLVGNARERAVESGVPFEIDAAWFVKRIQRNEMRCEASGVPLVIEPGRGQGQSNPYAPSIDQTKAGAGYTRRNARIICDAANGFFKNYGQNVCVPVAKGFLERSGFVAFRAADPTGAIDYLRGLGYTVSPPRARRVAA